MPRTCCKCGQPERNGPLLNCKSCHKLWHPECHDPPVPTQVWLPIVNQAARSLSKDMFGNIVMDWYCASHKSVISIDDSDEETNDIPKPVKFIPRKVASSEFASEEPIVISSDSDEGLPLQPPQKRKQAQADSSRHVQDGAELGPPSKRPLLTPSSSSFLDLSAKKRPSFPSKQRSNETERFRNQIRKSGEGAPIPSSSTSTLSRASTMQSSITKPSSSEEAITAMTVDLTLNEHRSEPPPTREPSVTRNRSAETLYDRPQIMSDSSKTVPQTKSPPKRRSQEQLMDVDSGEPWYPEWLATALRRKKANPVRHVPFPTKWMLIQQRILLLGASTSPPGREPLLEFYCSYGDDPFASWGKSSSR